VLVNGNSATIINDTDATIGTHEDLDVVAVTGKGLVNRVVDDFRNKMVKTTGTGGTDVHSGALANRFEAFKNLNIARAVFALGRGLFRLS
jgi:hypothetical protein